ncbi:ABC-type multidrug transport system fused ATPase/permease subunit [Ilumatobacter fluminis]|uniref:ABC-type multidrug transport system fused ATPase/permease subunit n=2 Tax=Ilumatobacter fluminis TaxID=467091 RepID=A0A4V3EJJ8_9ACTN|nr:ABC-type multidrug transport system fused ATPase/permease subunit [Ilumatobacter fluminis]
MTHHVMTEPIGRFSASGTIGRGLQEAPILRQGLALTWLLAAVGAGGRVIVPIVIQQAIDRGLDDSGSGISVDMSFVAWCAVIGIVAQLIAAVSQRTAIVRLGTRSEQALNDLRTRLINHIHKISLADHNEERRGALVARTTSDIETLAEFFRWGGLAWLINGTLMVIVAGVMLAYNWLLALIAIGFAIPLFIVLQAVQRHLVKAYETARRRVGDMLGSVSELVTGAETIREYDAGDMLLERNNELVKKRSDAQIRGGIIGAFLFPLGEVFSVVTIATIVAVGVGIGPGGGLTSGALIGFIFLTYRFLEPIAEFTEVLDQTQTAVAGLRRVLGVLDIPVEPPPPEHPRPLPAGRLDIDIDDVTFAYRSRGVRTGSDDVVLEHISIHIPAGQQVAMVGATGSGKTTLGRLIARMADPIAGDIRLGGVPLSQVADADLRSRLVVVAQEPFLFDDSIYANAVFSEPDTSRAQVDRLVDTLDIRDWIDSLPEGLDTRVGERGDALSAGERQLVALLRAGVADPDVLILDEATSSVDALTEVRTSRALQHLAEGRTTIAIAHRLSTAARADRVLVLDHGRLVEDGHHDELLTADGPYRRLYDAWLAATSTT